MVNPYAPTLTTPIGEDVADQRLNSVSRIFVWIGLPGTLIYVPIVIGCMVSLTANLIGRPISDPKIATPLVLAFATAFNSIVLSLWLTFIITGRQIKRRRVRARNWALALSILMTLAFPILTIPGIMCFRWVHRYLRNDMNREVP